MTFDSRGIVAKTGNGGHHRSFTTASPNTIEKRHGALVRGAHWGARIEHRASVPARPFTRAVFGADSPSNTASTSYCLAGRGNVGFGYDEQRTNIKLGETLARIIHEVRREES